MAEVAREQGAVESIDSVKLRYLEEENAKLRKLLTSVRQTYDHNVNTFQFMRQTAKRLLGPMSYDKLVGAIQYMIEHGDRINFVRIFVVDQRSTAERSGKTPKEVCFLDDESAVRYKRILEVKGPECRISREDEMQSLFELDRAIPGSVAVVPLDEGDRRSMVIGSKDVLHFNEELGVSYLEFLGDVYGAALEQLV